MTSHEMKKKKARDMATKLLAARQKMDKVREDEKAIRSRTLAAAKEIEEATPKDDEMERMVEHEVKLIEEPDLEQQQRAAWR